jgi:antitoxin component YwqK of YwqJK toxin-antitoxin module
MKSNNKIKSLLLSFVVSFYTNYCLAQTYPYHLVVKSNGVSNRIKIEKDGKSLWRIDGTHIIFYDSLFTKPMKIFSMRNTVLNGNIQHFNMRGVLIELGNYLMGEPDGSFLYWDNEGVLKKRIEYKDGKILSENRY